MQINSGMISREHAEVAFEDGAWWIRDLESTNGIYVDGARTGRVCLDGPVRVQLGRNAPTLHFSLESPGPQAEAERPPVREEPVARQASPPESTDTMHQSKTVRQEGPLPDPAKTDRQPSPRPPFSDPSLSQVIERYFEDDPDRPAGEHTMMIRRAYATVKKKEKKKYTGIIIGALVLLLVAIGYGVYQKMHNEALRRAVADMFYEIKQTDLEIAQLSQAFEETGGATLREQLARIRARRDAQADRYDGLVLELGLYRRLSGEEQLIYNVARIFNESQVDIPAGFIREVKAMIHEQWLTPGGRHTFELAIQTARRNEYIPYIVQALQERGLPPQFFYLAMQESKFDLEALGWYSHPRFGRAKGMWQFIPETARRYNLFVPEMNQNADLVVREDERHDFVKSTRAAALYLQEIYVTLAQASGLLAMASYNWGEGRVLKRLSDLPGLQSVDEGAMPENPRARNYWNFLLEYEAQMPDQTKEYVLKIFAAAVIGEDPRRFGFDFDNPLQPYLEALPSQSN